MLVSALQQSRQVPAYGIRSARPAGSNSRALDSKGGVPIDAQADNSQGATAGARSRIADKARDTATHLQDELQERAGAVLETAHAKVGNAQAVMADQLSAGAEVIRERAGARNLSDGDSLERSRLAGRGEAVAENLDRSAMWLRENDLADLGGLLRRQLDERPGRTALAAFALGLLVGRAIRR